MEYIKIGFHNIDREKAEIMMAVMSELPFDSFEEGDTDLFAFIKSNEYDRAALENAIDQYEVLSGIQFNETIIPPTNWNAVWERNFEPIQLNEVWSVRATFHQPLATQHEIIINPKMSFGTGHHATTFMMMELMHDIDFNNKQVFDFGSGTAILSIMASKLGASKVLALDHEEWAYHNAIENAALNQCNNIACCKGEIEQIAQQKFDTVLANINKNVLLDTSAKLASACHENSILLLSGILEDDVADIQKAYEAVGFKIENIQTRHQWCAIKLIKT